MRKALAALLALASTSVVEAQLGTSAYYGIALGSFDYEENADAFFTGWNDTADSWRVMVGYQFSEHLAVEGGYGKTGTLQGAATLAVSPVSSIDFAFTREMKSLMVRLLGVLPFDNGVSLLGGIGYADGEEDVTIVSPFGTQSGDVSVGDATLFVGGQYDWDRVALRLGYEQYDLEGDRDASEVTLSFFYKL
jgi:opacity protein-like surface antigen